MNKLKIILGFITALLITSCSVEPFTESLSNKNANVLNSSDVFFTKIDGVDFVTTSINANLTLGKIIVTGRRGAIENISLSLDSAITSGTYPLTYDGTINSGLYFLDGTSVGTTRAEGTLNIISHDPIAKKIIGTFNFVSVNPVITFQVTQGSFEVTYL